MKQKKGERCRSKCMIIILSERNREKVCSWFYPKQDAFTHPFGIWLYHSSSSCLSSCLFFVSPVRSSFHPSLFFIQIFLPWKSLSIIHYSSSVILPSQSSLSSRDHHSLSHFFSSSECMTGGQISVPSPASSTFLLLLSSYSASSSPLFVSFSFIIMERKRDRPLVHVISY